MDYFEILEVTEISTPEEIKKSYRRLAMKFHPDRNPDSKSAEDKFKQISEAYETLSSTDKRAAYIRNKNNKNNTNNAYRDSYQRAHAGSAYWGDDDLSDVFAEFFRSTRQTTSKIYYIELKDAYSGLVYNTMYNGVLKIPKGVKSGTKYQLKDCLYTIEIKPDSKFKRADDDLLVDITIGVPEAILGVEVILTHIDNAKLKFDIPSGIQSGQIVRLAGKGMPRLGRSTYGDLLVRCTVEIPKKISVTQTAFYRSILDSKTIEF